MVLGGRWGAGGVEEAYLREAPVITVGGAARRDLSREKGRREIVVGKVTVEGGGPV
jgi:hypothetical protein